MGRHSKPSSRLQERFSHFFSKYSVISLLLLHMTPVEIKVDKESFSIGRVEVLLFFLAKESPNLISWLTLSFEQRALEIMSDFNRRISSREKCASGHTLEPSRSLTTATSQDYMYPPDMEEDDNESAKDVNRRPVGLEEIRRHTAARISQKR